MRSSQGPLTFTNINSYREGSFADHEAVVVARDELLRGIHAEVRKRVDAEIGD